MSPGMLHESIVHDVVRDHGALTSGFRRNLIPFLEDRAVDMEVPNLIPDAFLFEDLGISPGRVSVWEVSVGNHLTERKLGIYINLWEALDEGNADLLLYEVDRYGTSHPIDFWALLWAKFSTSPTDLERGSATAAPVGGELSPATVPPPVGGSHADGRGES